MRRMAKRVAGGVLGVSLAMGLVAAAPVEAAPAAKKTVTKKAAPVAEVYSCPMHPEVKENKPGKCPKCGMFLEKQAPKKR